MQHGHFTPETPSGELAAFFRDNGYLVMTRAFSPEEIAGLLAETTEICRGRRGSFENVPRAPNWVEDDEVLSHYLCVHFPHKISPAIRATLFNPASMTVLTSVIGPNVKCMQSMLFIKAAGKPGQAWHQDEDYIPTRDRSLTGAWIALDDATQANGCLWVIPGSHRAGILWDQVWHGDRRFDCAEESVDFPYGNDDAVAVEVRAGSVIFFNGYLLHRSLPNRAPAGTYRRALVNHFMSAESFLPWRRPGEKEAMAKADYRDVVLVAGSDPYAHHGYADIAKPLVRPSGHGGCVNWATGEKQDYRDLPSA